MRKISLIMLVLIAILAYSVPNYENKDLEELNKIREEISEKTKEIEKMLHKTWERAVLPER